MQNKCVDIKCPEYHQQAKGQCVPKNVMPPKKVRTFFPQCFQVIRGSGNITLEIATLIYIKYMQIHNVEVNRSNNPLLRVVWCNDDLKFEYVCFSFTYKLFSDLFDDLRGFTILITDWTGLTYSASKSIHPMYLIAPIYLYKQCPVNSNLKQNGIPTTLDNMTDVSTLLTRTVCDNHELLPRVEIMQCQIHKNILTHDTNTISHRDTFDLRPEVILSFAMSSLSIVTLAPSLLYNWKFVAKWPLPRKIFYHQILMLLFSHLVTVLGMGANDIAVVCRVIGGIIHFLWLSMYCWTTVCAWHLYNVFAIRIKRMRIVDKQTAKSLFLRYRLCAYLGPLICIVPAVILEVLQWKQVYGASVCFISDNEILIFFFLFPIGFSCLFNILAYIATAYHVKLQSRAIFVLKSSLVFYAKIFVKIWFMLSLTSVSVFFAITVNTKTTWYVFICLYGVQSIASAILLGIQKDK